MFPRITEYVHDLIRSRVRPGDHVIDATMGNGHDTLFLAQLVGPEGKVYAYDIQPQAVESTRKLLEEKDVIERTELILGSHSEMVHEENSIGLIVFNLGYLPGSDKVITTTGSTTIQAIKRALHCLQIGGLVIVVIYWGHTNGKEEKLQVEDFLQNLPYPQYMVLKYQYMNPKNYPPFVLAVERRS